jgi:hypothetical protein
VFLSHTLYISHTLNLHIYRRSVERARGGKKRTLQIMVDGHARFWDWEALGNSRWSMPRCIIVEKQEGVCLEDLRASLLRGTQNVPAQSLDENG